MAFAQLVASIVEENSAAWSNADINSEKLNHFGIVLACMDITLDSFTSLFRSIHAPNVLESVYNGLIVAKRFDVLEHVSELVVRKLLKQDNVNFQLLYRVLVGYQHGPKLVDACSAVLHQVQVDNERDGVVFAKLLYGLSILHQSHQGLLLPMLEKYSEFEMEYENVVEDIRRFAWISKDQKRFPWFEGIWDVEKNGNNKTASSFRLHAKEVGVAKEFTGTLKVDGKVHKLYGHELQYGNKGGMVFGHFVQELDQHEMLKMQNRSQVVEWTCTTCTLINAGTSSKCDTCQSDAPKVDVKTDASMENCSNPAPFRIFFDQDTLRMQWSRGEVRKTWLGRKHKCLTNFTLRDAIQNLPPSYVYYSSLDNSCLVLPIPCTVSERVQYELWVQPEMGTEEDAVIISFGNNCLYISSKLHIGFKSDGEVIAQLKEPIAVRTWSKIEICFNLNEITIRGNDAQVTVAWNPVLSGDMKKFHVVGASIANHIPMHRFIGAICNLKMQHGVHLVGQKENWKTTAFFPLCEKSKYLMDASGNGNHAMQYSEWYDALYMLPTQSPPLKSCPLPDTALFISEYESCFLAGHAKLLDDGILQLTKPVAESKGEVWISCPFDRHGLAYSQITLDEIASSKNVSMQFCARQCSYWNLVLDQFGAMQNQQSTEARITIDIEVSNLASNNMLNYTFSINAWHGSASYALSKFSNLQSTSLSFSICLNSVDGYIQLVVGENSFVDLAVDILDIFQGASPGSLFFGLSASNDLNDNSVRIQNWTFTHKNATDQILPKTIHQRHQIVAVESTSPALRRCTKLETDGSAITQEMYGCNTCDIIHDREICTICAAHCHLGHDIVAMGNLSATCSCNNNSKCKALAGIADESPKVEWNLWKCASCTVVNDKTCAQCSVCGTKCPIETPTVTIQAPMAMEVEQPAAMSMTLRPKVDWVCSVCTVRNAYSTTQCDVCQTSRPKSVEEPDSSWNCTSCTMLNQGPSGVCSTCGTSKISNNTDIIVINDTLDSAMNTSENKNILTLEQLYSTCLEKQSTQWHESNLKGFWDLTSGFMDIESSENSLPFVVEQVDGEYLDGCGKLSGIMRFEHGEWALTGVYRRDIQTCRNAFTLNFTNNCEKFNGKWFRGDGSGQWCGHRRNPTTDYRGLSTGTPFYTGLMNMEEGLTNVCYQNSFLQLMFMSEDFRRRLLKATIVETNPPKLYQLFSSVQDLFAELLTSQRPAFATHKFQRSIATIFEAGRQQDASDFAHFVMDQLDIGFQQLTTDTASLRESFGGSQCIDFECKQCGHVLKKNEYFWELLLNMVNIQHTAIVNIQVVSGGTIDLPLPDGFERLNFDLNRDRDGAPYVFICVERQDAHARGSTALPSNGPITDIAIRTVPPNSSKPIMEGYSRIEMNLNIGGNILGDQVYLFFQRDPKGSPITDLYVTTSDEVMPDGFRKINVDLNQGQGSKLFLCYLQDLPIRDIKLVASGGSKGYKSLDESLRVNDDNATELYIAHTDGGTLPCITGIRFESCTEESQEARLKSEKWHFAGKIENLNVLMYLKRGDGNPIYSLDILKSPRLVPKFKDYDVQSLVPTQGAPKLHCGKDIINAISGSWKATSVTSERSRRAVKFLTSYDTETSIPEWSSTIVEGKLFHKTNESTTCTIRGVLRKPNNLGSWLLTGTWQNSIMEFPLSLSMEFVVSKDNQVLCSGTLGGAQSQIISSNELEGKRINTKLHLATYIKDIVIVVDGEDIPDGYVKLPRNMAGDTINSETRYVCIRSANTSCISDLHLPIQDIMMVYSGIDCVPENYICIDLTPGGKPAFFNSETSLYLCYKRFKSMEEFLSNPTCIGTIGLTLQSSQVAAGSSKLQFTPLGMTANLNEGTTKPAVCLWYAKQKVVDSDAIFEESFINGTFEFASSSPWSTMHIIAKRKCISTPLRGNFGAVLRGDSAGQVSGILTYNAEVKMATNIEFFGTIGQGREFTRHACGFVFDFAPTSVTGYVVHESLHIANGWYSGDEKAAGQRWVLYKDNYLQIAYKHDFGTRWIDGVLDSTERISSHDIPSMLARLTSPKTLGGENKLNCDSCKTKTDFSTCVSFENTPKHLILTIKRMWYNIKLQKTMKSMQNVKYPAALYIPQPAGNACYGLYGVLVHSGLSANSGHYYSYCRDNMISNELIKEDSVCCPWIKFNDSKVTVTCWQEMNSKIRNSTSDSVYMLMYKRIFVDSAMKVDAEEDESMLMAKAMSMSMSASEVSDIVIAKERCQKIWNANESFLFEQLHTSKRYMEQLSAFEQLTLNSSEVEGAIAAITTHLNK